MMMLRLALSSSLALALVACTASHEPGPARPAPRDPSAPDARVEADGGGACAAAFASCELEMCCPGTYCDGPYGPNVCTPTSADGAFCVTARECTSGTCVENVCGRELPSCAPAGEPCDGARACCEGAVCRAGTEGGTFCLPPGDDGALCAGAGDCANGRCVEGLCRAEACVAEGTECFSGAHSECCTGFCDFGFSYGAGICRGRLPAGAECYDAHWCASGACSPERVCL